MSRPIPGRLLDALQTAVGSAGLLTDPADVAPYLVDWRGAHGGAAPAILRPANTAEVAAAMRLCHGERVAVVPQGGNTGLCGGAVPDGSGSQLVLSLGRLRTIRGIDPVDDTITVEAGVVLHDVQEAAAAAGRLFPLSLGSEGNCTVGGNLATNAGGTGVLRYGMMRDLTLGLEVVLPDGRVWDGLRALRKDNTGYNLTQLFVGSEGTLGVITAAVLKLFPATPRRATAWIALSEAAAAVGVLGLLRERRTRVRRNARGVARGRARWGLRAGFRGRRRPRRKPGATTVTVGVARGHLRGAEPRGTEPQTRRRRADPGTPGLPARHVAPSNGSCPGSAW